MDIHEAEACVRLVPMFRVLDQDAVHAIAKLVHDHTFAAGETIFTAGTPAEALVIVAHGQAKVTQSTASGREQLLRVLQPGDFDGEAVLFTKLDHQTTATALTPLQTCTIAHQAFQALLRQSHELALNVMNALGQRLIAVEAHATSAALETVSERLANYLVETGAALNATRFDLPLAKKDLALYLGTTPETISRRLAQFKKSGLIALVGRQTVELLDPDGLAMVE